MYITLDNNIIKHSDIMRLYTFLFCFLKQKVVSHIAQHPLGKPKNTIFILNCYIYSYEGFCQLDYQILYK